MNIFFEFDNENKITFAIDKENRKKVYDINAIFELINILIASNRIDIWDNQGKLIFSIVREYEDYMNTYKSKTETYKTNMKEYEETIEKLEKEKENFQTLETEYEQKYINKYKILYTHAELIKFPKKFKEKKIQELANLKKKMSLSINCDNLSGGEKEKCKSMNRIIKEKISYDTIYMRKLNEKLYEIMERFQLIKSFLKKDFLSEDEIKKFEETQTTKELIDIDKVNNKYDFYGMEGGKYIDEMIKEINIINNNVLIKTDEYITIYLKTTDLYKKAIYNEFFKRVMYRDYKNGKFTPFLYLSLNDINTVENKIVGNSEANKYLGLIKDQSLKLCKKIKKLNTDKTKYLCVDHTKPEFIEILMLIYMVDLI